MPRYPSQYPYPFANQGNKVIVPPTAPYGSVSIEQGYDPQFSVPINLGGSEIERTSMNGNFYAVTDNIYQYQIGVKNYWRQYVPGTEQTTQQRQLYHKGALVWINKVENDDSTAVLICSKVDDNLEIPIYANIYTGSLSWRIVFDDFSNVKLTRGARILKGINETVMNGFIKLDGRRLTTQEYNAIPADIRSEITITDTLYGTHNLVDTRGFNKDMIDQYSYFPVGDDQYPYHNMTVTKYSNGKMTMEIYIGPTNATLLYFNLSENFENNIVFDMTEIAYFKIGAVGEGKVIGIYDQREYPTGLTITPDYRLLINSEVGIPLGNACVRINTYWYDPRSIQNTIFIDASVREVILTNPLVFNNKPLYMQVSGDGAIAATTFQPKAIIQSFPNVNGNHDILLSINFETTEIIGEYIPSTKKIVFNGAGAPNVVSGLNNIFSDYNNMQYDTVQQCLLSQTMNVTRATEYSDSLLIDGKTIKADVEGKAYVNLDPNQGGYVSSSGYLELTPSWNDIQNKPDLVTEAELTAKLLVINNDIDNVESMIPTTEDIDNQIKELTYVTPQGMTLPVLNTIPYLVSGESYLLDMLVHYLGNIYVVKQNFTWDGTLPNVSLELYSGVNIDNATIKENAQNQLYVNKDNLTLKENAQNQLYVNTDNVTIKADPTGALGVDLTSISRWIIVDTNTKYLKSADGTYELITVFTIPQTNTANQNITITFPIPFFLGAGELVNRYTVETISCGIVGSNIFYFSEAQYLNSLRINTSVANPIQAGNVSLSYTKTITNTQSGLVRVRILGFWKNPAL